MAPRNTTARAKVQRKPALAVDIGPMLDEHWTGIPVFTRRLVKALMRSERFDLHFAWKGVELPAPLIEATLREGNGSLLRDEVHRNAGRYRPVPRSIPMLYPSNKTASVRGRREASTVHDMSTLYMPENHEAGNVAYHTEQLRQELATDEVVFCASEATRAALLSAFPSVRPKAQVLYQYVDWPSEFPLLDQNAPPLRLGRYALVIGTLEPRKNLQLLLEALSSRQLARSDLRFIISGRKGWLVDSMLERLTARQRERVQFAGYVSEFLKYRLIKNAQFLVYPSLYEGFGIPALEALSLGKPVLVSRSSSLPEVVGKAGLYFDPLSVNEFCEKLKEIQNPKRLQELGAATLEQCNRFDCRQTAAPILRWLQ